MKEKGYFLPSLLGGLLLALLSVTPYIMVGNLFCFMWVIAGGVVAALIFYHTAPKMITPGQGAMAGFLAALWGTLFEIILVIVLWKLFYVGRLAHLSELSLEGILPEEFGQFAEFASTGYAGFFAGIALSAMFILNMVFSTIGGLIVGLILKGKEKAEE